MLSQREKRMEGAKEGNERRNPASVEGNYDST